MTTNISSVAVPNNSYKSFDITGCIMNPENVRAEQGFLRDLPIELAIALQDNTITDSQTQSLRDIVESGSDPSSFGWLVRSVASEGVQTPVEGQFDPSIGKFVVRVGNTRLAACLAANLLYNSDIKRIPGKDLKGMSEKDLLLRDFNSNEGGVSLTPYSKAILAKKTLKCFSGDLDECAKFLSIQKIVLEGYLNVLSLSQDAQEAIKNGDASVTAVAEIIREESKTSSPKEVLETVSEAVVSAVSAKRGRPKGSTKATKSEIKSAVSKKKPKNEAKIFEMKQDILGYCEDRNNLMEILDSLDEKDLKTVCNILGGK